MGGIGQGSEHHRWVRVCGSAKKRDKLQYTAVTNATTFIEVQELYKY